MMKYIPSLLFIFILSTSWGQNQTNLSQDSISKGHDSGSQLKESRAGNLAVSLAATSKVPVSMVRHIKQARNGDILIASYLGVFRYDGKTFTDFKSKEGQK